MSDFYKLDDDRNPVPCSLEEYGDMCKEAGSRVVKQETVGAHKVSTVFLGIDHRFSGDSPPIVFETMIFGYDEGDKDQYQERCSTWREAEQMHATAVKHAEGLK